MIQEIHPHRLYNQYALRRAPGETDTAFLFHGKSVLVRREGERVLLPTVADFPAVEPFTWLFRVDETDAFLLPDDTAGVPEGFDFVEVRALFWERMEPKTAVFAAFTAFHLRNWYGSNRFCGQCGAKTELHETLRALRCPQCGNLIFPRIVPAVLAAVLDGDRILTTKYRNSTTLALIAGFTEIGETLEETVEREVMEEVGLRVKNIRYCGSQPWGLDGNIMIGFFCDVDGDTTVRLDREELKEAVWLRREELPEKLNDYALTYEMMRVFAEGNPAES